VVSPGSSRTGSGPRQLSSESFPIHDVRLPLIPYTVRGNHLPCLQPHTVRSWYCTHFQIFHLIQLRSVILYIKLSLTTRRGVIKCPNNHWINPVILAAFWNCEAEAVKHKLHRPMWIKHKANHCFCNYFKVIRAPINLISCPYTAVSIIFAITFIPSPPIVGKRHMLLGMLLFAILIFNLCSSWCLCYKC
jgi:hypothetical protein